MEAPPSPTEIPQDEPKDLQELEHINKNRPRPKRNRPISKLPPAKLKSTVADAEDANLNFDEGLNHFFAVTDALPQRTSALFIPSDDPRELPLWSPTVSQSPASLRREPRVPDIVAEQNGDESDRNDHLSKLPLAMPKPDRIIHANVLAEMKAKRELRASGLFSVNVANIGSPDRPPKSPPLILTPKPKPRIPRKTSGSQPSGNCPN